MSGLSKLFLFRRNNGIYYIGYFQDGRKRWKSTGCKRKTDALKALTRFKEFFRIRPAPDESWVSHKFKYYVYALRLTDNRLHFHSLRHTFASWLVQDGVSLYSVQKLLGHSSNNVTQVYAHLQPEQLHSTVERLQIHI